MDVKKEIVAVYYRTKWDGLEASPCAYIPIKYKDKFTIQEINNRIDLTAHGVNYLKHINVWVPEISAITLVCKLIDMSSEIVKLDKKIAEINRQIEQIKTAYTEQSI